MQKSYFQIIITQKQKIISKRNKMLKVKIDIFA